MKTKLLPFLLLSVISALVFCLVPGAPPQSAVAVSATTLRDAAPRDESALSVLECGPQGEVSDRAEARTIHVTFDRKMVPMELPGEAVVGLFRIEPAVRGKFRWTGTQTLTFVADTALPLSTEYDVIVPAGVKALDGFALKEDYRFRFMTPLIRVAGLDVGPDPEDCGARDPFFIRFTQGVRLDAAEKIRVADAAGMRVPIRVRRATKPEISTRWNGLDRAMVLAVEPCGSWPENERLAIRIAKDLRGAEGSLGMPEDHSTTVKIAGPLEFVRLKDDAASHPYEGIRLVFSSRVRMKDVRRHLTFQPEVKFPKEVEDYDYASREISLPLRFQAGTEYRFRVTDGLASIHGKKIVREGAGTFTTRDLPPSISMISGHVTMTPENFRRPILTVTNVDAVRLQMAAVTAEELLGAKEFSWSVDRTWEIHPQRNEPTACRLPFAEVMDARAPHFLCARIVDPARPRDERTLYLQITSLGVTAKFSPDSIEVFVSTIDGARPVEGAEVSIYSGSRRLFRGMTSKIGLCPAPGWSAWGIASPDAWSAPSLHVIVRKGSDVAVLASNWSEGIEAWRFPIEHVEGRATSEIRGVVFSERGIYRPGDAVHLKGILRTACAEGLRQVDTRFVHVRVTGPAGEEAYAGMARLNRFGGFDADLTVKPDAAVGCYTVVARTDEDGAKEESWEEEPNTVRGSFRVAEYRPTRMKAEVALSGESGSAAHNGGRTNVTITGSSLAGTPLAGRKVRVTGFLAERAPSPAGWDEFSFSPNDDFDRGDDGDCCGGEERSENRPAPQGRMIFDREGTLDLHGAWSDRVRVRLPKLSRTDGELQVEATITELSSQTISARSSSVVEACRYVVGARLLQAFLRGEEKAAVEAIVLDRNEVPVPNREVTMTLVRRTWINRSRHTEGGIVWESKPKDEIVSTGTVRSGSRAVRWEAAPTKAGYYIVHATVKDERGGSIRAAASFYFCGEEGGWWMGNDDKLDLVPEKRHYKPGDVARVIVRSPFKRARAWVTIEREGIVSSRIETLSGSTPLIEIPIAAEHAPNIYVGVMLISLDTARKNVSSVRIGLLNIPVDVAAHRLRIEASSAQSEYEPGETATVRLRVMDHEGGPVTGECAVAVVDEGVLSLIGYRFPDPIPAFFAPHAHHVTTAELRTHLVDGRSFGEKGEEPAGDGSDGSSPKTEAWVRKDFNPTAVWIPSVATDAAGEAVVSFRLPHTITTYRVLVVAHDGADRFGSGDSTFLARRALVLEPMLPRFVRPGDDFTGGVIVRNLSGRAGTVELSCATRGARTSADSKVIMLAADQDTRVTWRFTVKPGADEVKFRCYGNIPGVDRARDAVEMAIPVRPAIPEDVAATSGSVVSGESIEWIKLPKNVRPDVGGLTVTVSSTALVRLKGAVEYLFEYPYGCLEQRTACVTPMIEFGDVAIDLGVGVLPGGAPAMKKAVKDYLDEVSLYQNSDGGFTLWKGGSYSYPYLTAIVVKTMIHARKRGYAVDPNVLDRATGYLDGILRHDRAALLPYNDRVWYAFDATAIEALAEAGLLRAGDLELAYRYRESMPLQGLAALYRAALMVNADETITTEIRRRLMNALRIDPTTAHFEEPGIAGLEWIYYSDATATAAVLEALLDEESPFAQAQQVANWLVTQRRCGRWRSTRENASVLAALAAYYRRFEALPPAFTATVACDGATMLRANFHGRTLDSREGSIRMAELIAHGVGETLPVTLRSEGDGRMYYELRLRGLRRNDDVGRDQGFSVDRRFETLDGNPVDPKRMKMSEVYRMRVVVTTIQERLFVVVDAPLPAGLEAIDLSLASEQQSLSGRDDSGNAGCWWNGFRRKELRDDRALWFADELGPGRYELVALVRATAAGRFDWPAARAEAMYEPEVYGRTNGSTAVIRAGSVR